VLGGSEELIVVVGEEHGYAVVIIAGGAQPRRHQRAGEGARPHCCRRGGGEADLDDELFTPWSRVSPLIPSRSPRGLPPRGREKEGRRRGRRCGMGNVELCRARSPRSWPCSPWLAARKEGGGAPVSSRGARRELHYRRPRVRGPWISALRHACSAAPLLRSTMARPWRKLGKGGWSNATPRLVSEGVGALMWEGTGRLRGGRAQRHHCREGRVGKVNDRGRGER
jgi:hypothetical protein